MPPAASDTAPSKAELSVLKHLWRAGAQSARQVQDAVGDAQGWSHSTTRTHLLRMIDKGLVAKDYAEGVTVYAASAEKVSLMSRMIRDFADRVLELDQPLPSTAFAQSRLFSQEEAEALGKLLADAPDEAGAGTSDGEADK